MHVLIKEVTWLRIGIHILTNLHYEDIVADVLGDREKGVGVGRNILGEGEDFAKAVGDGREELGCVGDRVGVVVVGDADSPQFDVLGYVADGPFSVVTLRMNHLNS